MRGYTGGLYAGPPSAQRGYERCGRFAGRGARGYRRPDERLAAEVCDRLAEDPALDANDMTVAVKDGQVTVAGSVADRQMKRDAESCIESVSGVRQVHNRLCIEPAEGWEGRSATAGRMGAYSEMGASEGQRPTGDNPSH